MNSLSLEMADCKMQIMLVLCSFILLATLPPIYGWGTDGHSIVCKIAQSRLSDAAVDAVKELLPKWAEDDLGSVCSWADQVKFRYRWSSPLHYINTPEICTYQYKRDCKDEDGIAGRCVAGAINNYTSQLLTSNSASNKAQNNLTEALLFLSHFMGDIHQPLHVGFADDKGGNTIDVHWYKRKAVLHHVWDTNIIETAEERFYDLNVDSMVDAIQQNITSEWADEVKRWETCSLNKTACPDIYASEGIKAACDWAYKGVQQESVLEDDYFLSRLPIVNRRLAQGGVRLAATLNRIFG
ncbi:endonuclease 2 [Hibiscus trionum]|uniref:Aspergillus nuclease S1 n=2 Tax=Hibiscus trionum TaxID=183268 RepID=A0A9W7I1Y3_HIBTR|nr:endonuclease 2 [Hibiscus trionum]